MKDADLVVIPAGIPRRLPLLILFAQMFQYFG